MTPFAVFTPLFRALTGGRYPTPTRTPRTQALSLERDWDDLLVQLGLPVNTFQDIAMSGSLHPHFHYRHFTKAKKDGGRREIVEPDVKLKRVQREIIARYFKTERPHAAAVAYRKKKSIANHVWPHAGAELLIAADVEDFFPSTNAGRVEDWWRERVHPTLARLLTLLTTYRGGLPQGAPTSPELSNFVNRELDERLAQRASAAGARYTRYCDDMVFSWRYWPGPPSDFENGIRAALHEFGYTLHPKKGWRVHPRRDEPEITGVILTRQGRVRLPDRLRRAMRGLRRSDDLHAADRLAGYLGYQAMVCKRPRR
ncbi:MAG TPA: reverse transcriptase family protein [Gemmataceae bacterium]|nr:reverse transcriptase family protein [Gemmataceae bacterium]